ncbi:acetyl-CoA carboxylase biotin carboxyl carrier protein subunit [bacterium]|nr:acetyl-CoA carboxylase biotin carboxyl carrier protein subunit [bacterium]
MAKASSQKNHQLVKWAESLAQLVRESNMSELRLECGGQALRLRRCPEASPEAAVVSPVAPVRNVSRMEISEDFGTPVKTNYVGVFRVSHPKTGKPMVKSHDTTETNQVLGWVECMGIRYEVVAPRAGTVAEVLVADSEPVEFGQVLLVIQ